ncbi:MAG: caspase family protein [Bryobacteraceae bacterium]|nr:caspase family protein [Bryobacteraceae bacterium]
MRSLFLLWAAAATALAESPVALVLEGRGASLLRAGSSLPVKAKAGDLIYSGDKLSPEARTVKCGVCPPIEPNATAAPFAGAALTRSLAGHDETPFLSELAHLAPGRRAEVDRALEELKGDPLYVSIARAETLARFGLEADAAQAYRQIRADAPELAAQRIFVLEEEAARRRLPKRDPTEGGKTYALLIGVSNYQHAQIRPLRYAHEDALLMEKFLRSPRGGGLAEDDVTVLVNERATTAAIKTAFETLLKRATDRDTVVLLIAAHGTVVESSNARLRGAYIVTYDSDPEDLAATALPMPLIQRFIREDLGKTARVVAFVDACRSGTIGTLPDKAKLKINAQLDSLTQTDVQLFLLTASRPGEVSFEGRQYGGGHGAFSFFLLEAMNGAADFDQDSKVTLSEMTTYVQQKVAEATVDKQHPREGGTLDAGVRISDTSKRGIELGAYNPSAANEPAQARSFNEKSRDLAVRVLNIRQAVDFDEAIASGRLLPDQPGNAFTAFRQLKLARKLSREQIVQQENRLRNALEERNQQVLLDYLKGDQKPATRAQFAEAARAINAAIQINGETPFLLSRLAFAEGRLAILDKRYSDARESLESALRLDPEAAFIYNALGTAYLEQAEYDLAAKSFREAIGRAPMWAYPRHNLALTQSQAGDTAGAIATYEEAVKLAPQHAYLVYNQGILYAKLNQFRHAEERLLRAAELSPDLAEPLTALAAVRVSEGKLAEAETLLRQAIAKDPSYLAARHNLAAVVARNPVRRAEAIALWRENLAAGPDYLRSRVSLAETLAASGDTAGAIEQYSEILERSPEFVAARAERARLRGRSGDREGAMADLRALPAGPYFSEIYADVERDTGRIPQALELYARAFQESPDEEVRSRLRAKMKTARAKLK